MLITHLLPVPLEDRPVHGSILDQGIFGAKPKTPYNAAVLLDRSRFGLELERRMLYLYG
jgi:hypothetical protein